MLFRKPFLDAIASGAVTLAFRRWRRPTVKAGGTLKTPVGVLAILAVEQVDESSITPLQARKAGFESVQALLDDLVEQADAVLYRVSFRLAGDDPRIALREESDLDAETRAELRQTLERMDRAAVARGGKAWTMAALRLIARNEAVRAGDLAPKLGIETQEFKVRVRRLKNLGLTESLGTGYRISPRGRALIDG